MVSGTQPGRAANTQGPPGATVFWGVVLVVAGLLLLSLSLGLVPSPTGDVVGVLFAIAGFAILASYVVLHTHWWTLIAGPTMLGLAGAIFITGDLGGAAFLGAIGVGFLLVALTGVRRWWAVIPGGTLVTLGFIAAMSNAIGGTMSGSVLFFGLALTFGVLALIRIEGHRMVWPVYPALGCLVFGLLLATSAGASEILWPLLLVAAGVFLLIRSAARPTHPPSAGS
ncbi:MAG TPA: hypothetical protein VEW68_02655 [Patescibacteria group bacterium]|nr:hypothetical protein [Patescibacteria group bacterium]